MKWVKRLSVVVLTLVTCVAYFLWPVMFPKDRNEELDITLQDGNVTRQFRIKRGYLFPNDVEPVQGLIVLYVDYPDMEVPSIWKQGQPRRDVQVSIQAGTGRITHGEYLAQQWKERGHLPSNGPGFDRYLGQQDGYDVYETLPNPKTGYVQRTLTFRDHDGNLVADGSRAQARILGNLVVKYDSSRSHGSDPRQMRIWVENFIRKIIKPPMAPVDPASTNKTPKE